MLIDLFRRKDERHRQGFIFLEDEESRFIYRKRLEHYEGGTDELLRDIIARYIPEFHGEYYSPNLRKKLVEQLKGKRKIVIFGFGKSGREVIDLLLNEGISIYAIVDNNEKKQGNIYCGVKVSAPFTLDYEKVDCVIITPYQVSYVCDIRKQLADLGYQGGGIEDREYRSVILEEKQYFDRNIIRFGEEETFVDAGVLNLGTSFRFIQKCRENGVKKACVIAFEPDRLSYARCKKMLKEYESENIELYNLGLWSSETTLTFDERGNGSSNLTENDKGVPVQVVPLDGCVNKKVTFIKMDIEGAELEALKGSRETIRKYRPKLAICIYHKREDLTQIPLFIKELASEYHFYIRHYSNSWNETVLYAVVD